MEEKTGLSADFQRYHNGRWVKDPPTKPGAYNLADRDGHQSGTLLVVISTIHGLLFALPGSQSMNYAAVWQGWRWSVPVPQLPKPPPWEE